ncbi:MAG TPA: polysaccharide biosynthesis/export family protein [Flavisolibacter sp.]|nr:polysaccharide biosynthesis/export family protein [Flavisolibacter sp.]
MRFSSLLFLPVAALAFSCTSQKIVTNNYLQKASDTSGKELIALTVPVIQKNDLLAIRVFSAANGIEPRTEAPYNLAGEQGGNTGFLVDMNGNIEYPQIGVVHAEGLTREELANLIKSKLVGQLNQPSVIVRFLNYRVTVLGEVRSPSTFTIPTERITILEALGLSGDITEFGRKDNLKVMREVNGQREIGTIDLTSKEMFNSPYYYLQQNDVVFVEQTGRRIRQQEQQSLLQQIGIVTTIITAVALVLNLIK